MPLPFSKYFSKWYKSIFIVKSMVQNGYIASFMSLAQMLWSWDSIEIWDNLSFFFIKILTRTCIKLAYCWFFKSYCSKTKVCRGWKKNRHVFDIYIGRFIKDESHRGSNNYFMTSESNSFVPSFHFWLVSD